MKKFLLLGAVLGIMTAGVNSAFACSCMQTTPEQAFKDSENVYVARIDDAADKTKTKITVLETFK